MSLTAPERSENPWSSSPALSKLPQGPRKSFLDLLLVRTVRPDRFVAAATRYMATVFGGEDFMQSAEPNVADAASEDDGARTPIMLCSKPGYDASLKVTSLAVQRGKRCTELAIGSEGFGIVEKAIVDASNKGEWVLLKNVHLATQWLVQMEKKIYALNPNPSFRLFMTSEIHPKLPASLLRNSHVLTYEPPPGVLASLQHALGRISPQRMERAPVERSKLYFLLAWFHSVVIERLRYVPHGWTKAFEFGEGDERGSLDTIDDWIDKAVATNGKVGAEHISPEDIPWVALRTLLSGALYGGRVDNPVDQQVLQSLVNRLFVPESITQTDFPLLMCSEKQNAKRVTLPSCTKHAEFMKWVTSLSVPESPDWLGLPPDADLLRMAAQTKEVLRKLAKMQGAEDDSSTSTSDTSRKSAAAAASAAAGDQPEIPAWMRAIMEDAQEWLKALPSKNAADTLANKVRRSQNNVINLEDDPVRRCLERDAGTIASLSIAIRADLEQAIMAAHGEIKQTNDIRSLLNSLSHGTLPQRWKRYVVPDSVTIGVFMRDVTRRFAQLEKLIGADEYKQSPRIWLGGLLNPEAFTTATRQSAARAQKCSLETLRLETIALLPLDNDSKNKQDKPLADLKNGVFAIDGMCLENGILQQSGVLDSDTGGSGRRAAIHIGTAVFAWKSKTGENDKNGVVIDVPVFLNETRSLPLFDAHVPIADGEHEDAASWSRRSVALTCWQNN